jgi:hypothetical protein
MLARRKQRQALQMQLPQRDKRLILLVQPLVGCGQPRPHAVVRQTARRPPGNARKQGGEGAAPRAFWAFRALDNIPSLHV